MIFAAIGGFILIRSFAFYDPTALVLYHPDGTLIQSAGDPQIYLIQGHQRHFVSLDAFRSGQFDFSDIQPATTGDEQYDIGAPIIEPSGLLTQDRFSGSYYLTDMNDGQIIRRPVAPAAAAALGYNLAKAQVVTDLPPAQGQAEAAGSAHPEGSLISLKPPITRGNASSQTYLIQNRQLHQASAAVLATYKLKQNPVLLANQADMALPKGAALNYASGTLVQGSDPAKTYVIENDNGSLSKRLIRSAEVLTDLGYKTSDIKHLADSQLPAIDGLPLPENDGAPIQINVNLKAGQDGTALARDYASMPNTKIRSAYSDWVAMSLPENLVEKLKSDSRVAKVYGSPPAAPAAIGCEDNNGNTVPCPQITNFDTSPGTITAGQSTTIEWHSVYTDYCSASGGWGGQKATGGSEGTGALSASTNYSLSCTGSNGTGDTATATTGVTVNPAPPPPPPPPSGGGSVSNTGLPSISGNLAVGSTLTTNNGSWSGNPTSFSYLWQRCDPNAESQRICTNIGSATASSYVIQNGDAGFYLQVKVTASNGGSSASATSSPTATVPPPASSPPPPPSAGGGVISNVSPPVLTGTASVGFTLTTTNGTWNGSPVTFNYSWQRCDPNAPTQRICTNESTGFGQTYVIQPGDAGFYIQAQVTASNGPVNKATATSNATNVVYGNPAGNPPPPGGSGSGPVINSFIYNSGNSFNYSVNNVTSCQIHTDNPKGGIQIFTPTNGGTYSVTAGNGGGGALYCYNSAGTGAPQNGIRAGPTAGGTGSVINLAQPSISGTTKVGSTLSASSGSWTGGPTKFSYLWQRCDPNVDSQKICTNIGTATASSYTIQSGDANYQLQVRVTASNSTNTGVATSLPSAVIQENTPPPSAGGCDGSDGVYLYAGANYTGSCSRFTTSSSLAANWAVGNDKTSSIKVVGSWTADLYQDANFNGNLSEFSLSHASLDSFDIGNATTSSIQVTAGVTPQAPTNCTNPTLPGVYLYNGPNYSGSKCDYFTGTSLRSETWNIPDNLARSVKIIGNFQTVLYTGAKLTGNSYAYTASSPTIPGGVSSLFAAKTGATPPTNTALPVITGDLSAGKTLSTSNGSWANPQPTSYQYEWEQCDLIGTLKIASCVTIGGAVAKTYTLKTGDVGHYIRSTVWATNVNGSNFAVSNPVGQVTNTQAGPVTAQDVAKQILANSHIGRSGRLVTEDLQAAAAGKPGTAGAFLSLNLLELIAGLGQSNNIDISALESGGTGHASNSNHYQGTAVDFDNFNGSALSGRDSSSMSIIRYTEANFTSGRFGQSSCGPAPPLPAGFSQFDDSCNHLHVDSVGAPRLTFSLSQSSQAPVINAFGAAADQSVLSWSTSNATLCIGSNGTPDWNGPRELSSSSGFVVGSLAAPLKFSLTCLNSFGRTARDITVQPTQNLAQKSPGLAAIGWQPGLINNVVAVVGTGVDPTPGLNVAYSYGGQVADCSAGAGNYDGSADKHDTEVAKLIGLTGDGLASPAGVAPGATIVAVRATPAGSDLADEAGIACGIRWAADRGIKIINISSAAAVAALPAGLDLNNCNAANTEAELQAICYAASKGAKVVAAAGNYATDVSGYIPARYNQTITVTSANEFNGQAPNSSDAVSPPKKSADYVINGFSGFCGQGQDDFGQAAMDYDSGKTSFYAAPVCVWLGQTVGPDSGYAYGTSFAAAMASGVLARGGNLAGGGAVGRTNGHYYGAEIHL